jgi:UDP-N-acetylmuramoylalanine--D-glutamate ligase
MTVSLAGERIGVLGLARSGLAAARLALARGARVYASDAGESEEIVAAAEEIRGLGGEADAGWHDLAKLAGCDRIVLSPGIPPTAGVLSEPEVEGKLVVPELELAAEQIDAPLIVITGTNGKTTTTALVLQLLRACGFRAEAGGNIGRALSEVALLEPPPEVVAVEASSFQLGGISAFSADVGVVTNLAPDHLDRYARVEDYYADKARLFENATDASRWVLNGEDEQVRALPGRAPGERYYFRLDGELPPDERGGYLAEDGWLTLRVGGSGEERLLLAESMTLLGPHNIANALAAAIAVRLVGGEAGPMGEGLRTFGALEHRLEPVAEREGVLWINDSKATNLASTRVALRSVRRPIVLLLGGRHKGEPYTGLLPELRDRVRQVIAYGEAAPEIERDLAGIVPVERMEGGFAEVVRRAAELALPGDAVLLSPACSSYDMFTDFEERGRDFRELARGGAP